MNKKAYIIHIFVCFALGQMALANEKKAPPKCQEPEGGAAWLQDFTPTQKAELDVEWKGNPNSGIYVLEGTYKEDEQKDVSKYSNYSNETTLEAEEYWKCSKEKKEFSGIQGKMESELEWQIKTDEIKQSFESENIFKILDINNIRHVKHESEKSEKINSPWLKKQYSEELEWIQKWDNDGMPTITGTIEIEIEEESHPLPEQQDGKRNLANAVLVPGFAPTRLLPGRRLTMETKKKGKLNGPADPVLLETAQIAKQWQGKKVVEEKQLSIKETRYYLYDPSKKEYDFLSMSELLHETSKNIEENQELTAHRIETWSNLNKPPDKSSFWKKVYQKSSTGKSSTFTVASNGHDLLPSLFDVKSKNGSFTRITDYNQRGKIIRFLVLYFPSHKKGNETKMDLKFDDNGKLAEFTVDDGINELESYENPFNNPAALDMLQNKIKAVITMEKLSKQKVLPQHTLKGTDYPLVYVKTPKSMDKDRLVR